MNVLDWFKPKNKKSYAIPSADVAPLRGVDLVRAFSTEDEPKCKDFPREKYSVYWEIFVEAVPGGYAALLRFYSYDKGIKQEHTFTKQSLSDLRQEVTNKILEVMDKNKR